jgi:hypothetical protein
MAMATTLQLQAQQTNLVQSLSFGLTGIAQGGTVTNRNTVTTAANTFNLGNRDLLKAIGTATGTTFSPAATLQLVTPLPAGVSYVVVQDGSNTVNVADFFDVQTLSGTVETSQLNTRTSRFSGTEYYVELFVLQDGSAALNVHFNVNGLAVDNITYNGGVLQSDDVTIQVVGTGDKNGQSVIFQGEIRVHGTELQVIQSSPTS